MGHKAYQKLESAFGIATFAMGCLIALGLLKVAEIIWRVIR